MILQYISILLTRNSALFAPNDGHKLTHCRRVFAHRVDDGRRLAAGFIYMEKRMNDGHLKAYAHVDVEQSPEKFS